MSSHNFHTSLPFCGSPVHCVVCLVMQSQQPLTTNLIMSEKEFDSPFVQLSDEGLLLRILTSHTTLIAFTTSAPLAKPSGGFFHPDSVMRHGLEEEFSTVHSSLSAAPGLSQELRRQAMMKSDINTRCSSGMCSTMASGEMPLGAKSRIARLPLMIQSAFQSVQTQIMYYSCSAMKITDLIFVSNPDW